MSEEALLKSWREHREMLWPMENPAVVSPMYRRGWEARQSEVDGLLARIGGLEAELSYFKGLAKERD